MITPKEACFLKPEFIKNNSVFIRISGFHELGCLEKIELITRKKSSKCELPKILLS